MLRGTRKKKRRKNKWKGRREKREKCLKKNNRIMIYESGKYVVKK